MSEKHPVANNNSERQEALRSALKPELWKAYEAEWTRLGYPPEIVVNFKESKGNGHYHPGKDGKVIYDVPQTGIVFNLYISEHFTDRELAGLPKADKKIQRMANEVAKTFETGKVTVVLTDDPKMTTVFQSRDGSIYLQLSRKHLDNPNIRGIIAHEFGHVDAHDYTQAKWKEMHKHGGVEALRSREDQADMTAIKHCYGPEVTRALVTRYADEKYEAHSKQKTLEEIRHNDVHTPGLYRLANAVEASRKAVEAGICKAEEATLPEAPASIPNRPKTTGKVQSPPH